MRSSLARGNSYPAVSSPCKPLPLHDALFSRSAERIQGVHAVDVVVEELDAAELRRLLEESVGSPGAVAHLVALVALVDEVLADLVGAPATADGREHKHDEHRCAPGR